MLTGKPILKLRSGCPSTAPSPQATKARSSSSVNFILLSEPPPIPNELALIFRFLALTWLFQFANICYASMLIYKYKFI